MITNPFSRKPKSPLDQALDRFDDVRAEAALTAAMIRDAASKAADALDDPPVPGGRRLPLIGAVIVAGLGIALALKVRAGRTPAASTTAPPPPAVATAAKSTTTQPAKQTPTPAAEVEPETPKDPHAKTSESEAASG